MNPRTCCAKSVRSAGARIAGSHAVSRCLRIHRPGGLVLEQSLDPLPRPTIPPATRTIAHRIPITAIMTSEVVCASTDLPVSELIRVMVRERLGCLPVVDDDARPQGMVTKLDIVTQLVDPSPASTPRASDVMMPLAISLDEHATVATAAALLAIEDLHHVMVVAQRRLIGIVSTMDVTRWLATNDGGLR